PELQALLAMVQLRQDRAIPPNFEAMHVVVEVDLADGRRLTQRCEGPDGAWGAAPISEEDHRAKIEDCLGSELAPDIVSEVVARCGRFDRLDSSELGRLMTLLGGSRQR
ncbi:MAG: hypothetical protein ACKV2O_22070, partial [Acidimicrobiales bacterium]